MTKKIHAAFLLIVLVSLIYGEGKTHHKISVTINPAKHTLGAVDQITLTSEQVIKEITFSLNNNLKVTSATPGVIIKLLKKDAKTEDVGIDREEYDSTIGLKENKYVVTFKNKKKIDTTFVLKFSGAINYPITQAGEEYARGFSQTPGVIDEKGVYLAGSTTWLPKFDDELISFELSVTVPDQWNVVSQGKRTLNDVKKGFRTVIWDSPEPTEEIYLIAAKFTEYSRSAGAITVFAFLRTPDEGMANKYLEATAQYLELYRKLIGPYPYSKFALVENFWETGYGMPSFTLLGEQIIRFPFILNSSYPHELLHNYWGNSVYVDSKTGNWCEGLTAYLADHLIAEQRGQAEDYRRATLQKYTDYVTAENDFPLNKFRSRYSGPSEAIGYGKTSMVWNMLRDDVGDDQFIKAFQKFYRENKYRSASFGDIRAAFEATTGKNLKPFFDQWVDRMGAPELQLSNATVKKDSLGYHLSFSLKQIQKEDIFSLNVPVALSFEKKAEIKRVLFNQREQLYEFTFADNPVRVQVDPQFNLFRKLHFNEIPPSLTKILGAQEILILLPSKASNERLEFYKDFATRWSGDVSKKILTVFDSAITELPADKSVWILGTENTFVNVLNNGLQGYSSFVTNDSIRLDRATFQKLNHSFVITTRHPKNPTAVIAFISTDSKDAIQGLAKKIPHYGKYSYLVFEGTEPTNIAKGEWASVGSPLDVAIVPVAKFVELPKRKALATLDPVFSPERLKKSVNYLAGEELTGRAPGSAGIAKAADFIVDNFKAAGLLPGADDSTYYQSWSEVIDSVGTKAIVKNIIGIIPGTNPNLKDESVVISAHYDHLGLGWPGVRKGNEGKIHFGADDNASGVSVLLELGQTLGKTLKPQRTIVFVAFTTEEEGLLGSRFYVKNTKRFPINKVIGDLNFDAVGRLGNNKVSILSASSAREWRFIFMGASYVTGVESEVITQELDASDQRSFIEAGIPGVQFFSGVNGDYHRPSDTPDKIDVTGLVKIATLGREAVVYLGDRIEPLAFQGHTATTSGTPATGERRVSTGSIPDFAYTGQGVRIADLAPDSPAAKAGLQKGDVVVKLGETKTTNLREYSDALKNFKPGDIVEVVFQREGKERKTKIELIVK